ncbi:hypothetical protein JYU34_000316 [Plutella xylostella]|uniref:Very-long-chain 3-oxoacyl-CoA synthase n=1 Tax=Plutella xylostella TaxID=51655 RepID=A0ABQ7R7D8_PLUXY|nr:hypothetical protein JYU34_000316 [Plutella xylostella]
MVRDETKLAMRYACAKPCRVDLLRQPRFYYHQSWRELCLAPLFHVSKLWDVLLALFSGTNHMLISYILYNYCMCKCEKITRPNPFYFRYYVNAFTQFFIILVGLLAIYHYLGEFLSEQWNAFYEAVTTWHIVKKGRWYPAGYNVPRNLRRAMQHNASEDLAQLGRSLVTKRRVERHCYAVKELFPPPAAAPASHPSLAFSLLLTTSLSWLYNFSL